MKIQPSYVLGLSTFHGTQLSLSPGRISDLQMRVHRGALLLKCCYVSSAWIQEVLDPQFTIGYLAYRLSINEESYFASIYGKLESRSEYSSKKISSQVFFGFDIEPQCSPQSMHYRVMDDLWRHEARTMLPLVIG